MNGMRFDVSTFGNHEHDRPLAHLRQMIDLSEFNWVGSNYDTLAGLKGEKNAAKPFVIVQRGGIKLGVVGMNTPETKDVVFPGNLTFNGKDIVISESSASTQKAVADAKKAGADLVVLLVHEGWVENVNGAPVGRLIDLAREVKGIAGIYGAHSHQEFAALVGGLMVGEVRNSGVQYTRTQKCVNLVTKELAGSALEFINKAAVTAAPDAAVAAMVAAYKDKLTPLLDQKIGTVSAVFPRGGSPAVERAGEAALGNLMADAIRERTKTDFALINGGGIRDRLPSSGYTPSSTTFNRPGGTNVAPFDIALGDAYTVFPFGNTIATTTVTGAKLWAALENGMSGYPGGGQFAQISGFKYSFDSSKPVGSRIVSVSKLDGSPIAKNDTSYTISTVDFMVFGGDGYTQFDPKQAVFRELLLDVFVDKLKADLAAGKATVPVIDGRIIKVNP
jgi:2',3'-cyclic-nucleotide 2'-phosphodiesterase (5'-nucleotidase family)